MPEAPSARRRPAASGFDPGALRAQLPDFDLQRQAQATEATLAYLRFYGLDFDSRLQSLHHFGGLDLAGYRIACHFYRLPEPRGCCVLVHGYFDHSGLYRHLIRHCLDNAYEVMIWDLPGHGLSSGECASIGSFDNYVEVLRALLSRLSPQLGEHPLFIGQSTGAAILMNWLQQCQREGLPVADTDVVLLAPLVRPAGWRVGAALYPLLRQFRRRLRRDFRVNSSDSDFLAFQRTDPLQSQHLSLAWVDAMRAWISSFESAPISPVAPVLIQGDADHTVDWQYNIARIRLKFPGARVKMISRAGHQLVNESSELREQIFSSIPLSKDARA